MSNRFYIVQFSDDGTSFRLVNKCLFDGYTVGDRFLEQCMFEISVDDNGQLSVKADDMTRGYLESTHTSIEKWEKTVYNFLMENSGYDACQADFNEEGWDDRELHIAHNLDFYVEECELLQKG